MELSKLKEYLDKKYDLYNRPSFIEKDPVSIPHQFSNKYDIEISGFLTATIAWGQRKSIINNARKLMDIMDNSPYDFIKNIRLSDLKLFDKFVHRTFNNNDCTYFLLSLNNIINKYDSIGDLFLKLMNDENDNVCQAISKFRELFFELPSDISKPTRHLSNPMANSAAKRFNMYLRWMVRKDNRGVDFGIWDKIKMSSLMCPLDVHSGRISRNLGILTRKQDDWKAVVELTDNLKIFDPNDPVKYDFALFGIGVSNDFQF